MSLRFDPDYHRALVDTHPCPECGAGAGAECEGVVEGEVHLARALAEVDRKAEIWRSEA